MHWRRPIKPERVAWLWPVLLILLVLLVSLLGQCVAQAQIMPGQPPCADRAGMVEQLKEKFGETVRGMGLTDAGGVMELYASEKGSWTLVLTLPSGRACLVATGQGWEQIERKTGKEI